MVQDCVLREAQKSGFARLFQQDWRRLLPAAVFDALAVLTAWTADVGNRQTIAPMSPE